MSEHKLAVTKREGVGRGASRRLRAQGKIPAVIYGKSGNRNLSVDERDFRMLMREMGGSATVLQITEEGAGVTPALIHEFQRNSRTDRFEHIDFHEVDMKVITTANIPVHTVGTPEGVKNEGGVLDIALYELEVECLPTDLPEEIKVDVAALNNGESIHIRDLKAPAGVRFTGEPDSVVVQVAGRSVIGKSVAQTDAKEETEGEESEGEEAKA